MSKYLIIPNFAGNPINTFMNNKSSVLDFEALTLFEANLSYIYTSILKNNDLCTFLDREITMPQPKGKDLTLAYKVMMIIYIDLLKCYINMGHGITLRNSDSYLLALVLNLEIVESFENESDFMEFIGRKAVIDLFNGLRASFVQWAQDDGPEFIFTRYADRTPEICREYIELMLNASLYIRKALPTSFFKELSWIDRLKNIARVK